MKYVQRYREVDAFVWTGDIDQQEDPEWIVQLLKSGDAWFMDEKTEKCKLLIKQRYGVVCINRGDYVLKNNLGQIWGMRPKGFNDKYIRVHEDE